MGPGGLATPNRAGVCGRPPTNRPLLAVWEDGGVYSPSFRSRAVRLPPTPCCVCFIGRVSLINSLTSGTKKNQKYSWFAAPCYRSVGRHRSDNVTGGAYPCWPPGVVDGIPPESSAPSRDPLDRDVLRTRDVRWIILLCTSPRARGDRRLVSERGDIIPGLPGRKGWKSL